MSKITLIGIDTAKNVFHLVGIDKNRKYVYRKKLSRKRLFPALAQLEACEVVLEACAASHHWARSIRQLGPLEGDLPRRRCRPQAASYFAGKRACIYRDQSS